MDQIDVSLLQSGMSLQTNDYTINPNKFHIAVFCCRQTVTLRTMTWVMSKAQWLDEIPKAMQISEALACVVRANAVNYTAGATETPHQAFTEYASALKFLQRDLYDSISYETLFAVLYSEFST